MAFFRGPNEWNEAWMNLWIKKECVLDQPDGQIQSFFTVCMCLFIVEYVHMHNSWVPNDVWVLSEKQGSCHVGVFVIYMFESTDFLIV